MGMARTILERLAIGIGHRQAQRNPRGALRMLDHDSERHPRGARPHPTRAFRRYQLPRDSADRRWGVAENLDKRIREETGLPVSIADDPLASVVLGTGKMLSDFRLLRLVSID